MPRNLPFIIAFALLLSLAGCSDWHLRGTRTDAVPIKSAFVDAPSAPRLRVAVTNELRTYGVALAKRKDAQARIEMRDEKFDRRVLSVDPDTGKVREVELELEVAFAVRGPDGNLVVPPEKLNWVQSFIFDENSLLGTVEKSTVIQAELAVDAAQTIMLRLETIDWPAQ